MSKTKVRTKKQPSKAAAPASKEGRTYTEATGESNPRVMKIWDNYDQPFHVVEGADGMLVYVLQMEIPHEGYFDGQDTSSLGEHGNSVLVKEEGGSYVYIGSEIYRFSPGERIVDYYSPMGNNGVPYPVAYGEENVYFMLEQQYVPKASLKTKATRANAEAIYGEFYESFSDKARRFEVEVLKQRQNQ